MTKPTVIRFEATNIEADLVEDIGLLTMDTPEGRIAVWMKRDVLETLYVRMRIALELADPHVPPQTKT